MSEECPTCGDDMRTDGETYRWCDSCGREVKVENVYKLTVTQEKRVEAESKEEAWDKATSNGLTSPRNVYVNDHDSEVIEMGKEEVIEDGDA